MTDDKQRRWFQKVKSLSFKHFISHMNDLHTRAYALSTKHLTEAMSCHPRISKKIVEEILLKAEEIREKWDGLKLITVDDTEDVQFKTAEEIVNGISQTEAIIYKIESEHMLWIAGKAFVVRPATEQEIKEAN